MARHDHILIAPSRGRLVSELVAAQSRANEEVYILDPLDHGQWESIAAAIGDSPEGRRQWSDSRRGDTGRVAVAWWTDHIGRRHFRVVAGNSRDGSYRNLSSTRTDLRPPIWHVYPERLFWRERDGRGEWVAVCGCGESGPPGKLGWMGHCCAVCHDRAQEDDRPEEVVSVPTLTGHRAGPDAIAFSSDGLRLANVRAEQPDFCWVRIDDLRADVWRDLPVLRVAPECLAFSPDGRLLACTEGNNRLLVRNLDDESVVLDYQENFEILCVAFAPHGLALAVGGPRGVHIWEREGRAGAWQLAHTLDAGAQALAWSPSGDRLALGGRQLMLFESGLVTSLAPLPTPHAVWAVEFVENGRGLLCLSGPGRWLGMYYSSYEDDPAPQVLRYDLVTGRETFTHEFPGMRTGRFFPDGTWLAWVTRGQATVRLRRVGRQDTPCLIRWDLEERIVGLTFSPDGESLAAIGAEGRIKSMPWRLLVG